METATIEKGAKGRRVASYLVANYIDIKDVVFTIEKMIMEHSEVRNKSLLRQGCDLSIKPVGEKEGYIVQIRLPEEMS